MNEYGWIGWVVLAAVVGFILYDMAALWAALRVHAQSGEWLLAVGGMDEDDEDDDIPLYPRMAPLPDDPVEAQPADGDDYTYAERPEMLLSHYDVRTYPEQNDERVARLEDAIRKLERRLAALEGGL